MLVDILYQFPQVWALEGGDGEYGGQPSRANFGSKSGVPIEESGIHPLPLVDRQMRQ